MNEPEDTDRAAALLATIRPSGPRPEFMSRLLALRPASAAPPPAVRSRILCFLPRLMSAAAVFTVTAAAIWICFPRVENQPASRPTASAGSPAATASAAANRLLAPQQTSQRLLGVRDLGISRDAQSRPVRLMQATWLDDTIYPPSGDGAPPVHESRVREEIVPVVLTTY